MSCDRCTGHCCTGFTLPYPQNTFIESAWYQLGRFPLPPGTEPAHVVAGTHCKVPLFLDAVFIADMIIPVDPVAAAARYHSPPAVTSHFFRCRHLKDGNCSVYERRPRVCSEYPYGRPCVFKGCTWVNAEEATSGKEEACGTPVSP